MLLETDRCLIRPSNFDDKTVLLRLCDDRDVWKYLGGLSTAEHFRKNIENQILSDHNRLHCTIRDKVDNLFLGYISLTPHHDGIDTELSYMILSAHWGKGYASEAASEIICYAFTKKLLTRLVAETQSANLASCKMLEKLGFYQLKKIIRFNAEQIIWVIDNPKQ